MQNAYPFSSFLMNFDNFLTSSTKQFAKLLFTPFAVTFADPFKIRFANGICSHTCFTSAVQNRRRNKAQLPPLTAQCGKNRFSHILRCSQTASASLLSF